MWPCVCVHRHVTASSCICVFLRVQICSTVSVSTFVWQTVKVFQYSPVFTDRYWTGLSEQLWLHYPTLQWVDTDHNICTANTHSSREIFKRAWRQGVVIFENFEAQLFCSITTSVSEMNKTRLSHICVFLTRTHWHAVDTQPWYTSTLPSRKQS